MTRADLDRIDGLEPAGEVRVLGDLPFDGITDRDRGWRRRRRRLTASRTACQAEAQREDHCGADAEGDGITHKGLLSVGSGLAGLTAKIAVNSRSFCHAG